MVETSNNRRRGKFSAGADPQTDSTMSNVASFDSEPLQTLLASAYMVQGSGMQPQVLARIMQIQKSIEARDFDLNTVLDVIAEQVRSIGGASGVAIALLRKGQLIYGAGTGSAASYVGRSVAATLSTSRSQAMTSEILRVENADNDPRIQAAICRQFGAKSLLILPVLSNGSLSAVLQIIFDDAHYFAEQEIRAYWVFSGLIGDAIRASWHPAVSQASPPKEPVVRDQFVQGVPSAIPAIATPPTPAPQPAADRVSNMAFAEATEVPEATPAKTEPVLQTDSVSMLQPVLNTDAPLEAAPPDRLLKADVPPIVNLAPSTIPQPKVVRVLWLPIQAFSYFKRAWDAGVAVAIVAALFTLVFYRERPSANIPGSRSVPDKTNALQTPLPADSVKQAVEDSALPAPEPRRLPRAPQKLAYTSNVRVRHFGDDVTVRYFTPRSVIVRTDATKNGVHHFSDDVTVRYFKPRDADQSSQ